MKLKQIEEQIETLMVEWCKLSNTSGMDIIYHDNQFIFGEL